VSGGGRAVNPARENPGWLIHIAPYNLSIHRTKHPKQS
jgi:hypothetical protein